MSQSTNELNADVVERQLLARFTSHPVLQAVGTLPDEQFLAVLLQRRFLSLIFTTVYDIGIDALSDETATKFVGVILREEYPDDTGETRSHREDLVGDLDVLGATKAQVLGCRPTAVTTSILLDTLELIGDSAGIGAAGDVKVLAMLRFWGEVLVSVEYGMYWKRMERLFQDAGVESEFYLAHINHDGCEALTDASDQSVTHSGMLGACLKRLLATPDADAAFLEIETRLVEMRLRFYDQFLPAPPEYFA